MTLLLHTGDSTWEGVPCPVLSVPLWWLRVLVLSEQVLALLLVSVMSFLTCGSSPVLQKKTNHQTFVTWLC